MTVVGHMFLGHYTPVFSIYLRFPARNTSIYRNDGDNAMPVASWSPSSFVEYYEIEMESEGAWCLAVSRGGRLIVIAMYIL